MDCLTFTEIDSNEWSDRLLAPLEGRRYHLGGSLDLTARCNLNCVHCYIRQPAGDEAVKAGEMTTDQFTWLIDRMAEAGTLFLLITGGEPLLRPDFEQIYTHAKRRGMLISLFTNATLLTPRIAETARGLWAVYFAIATACLLGYRWAGMSWPDAFMHICSTMGLGGLAGYDASFAAFDSLKVELVAIVFMLLAGVNFALYFRIWQRRPPERQHLEHSSNI